MAKLLVEEPDALMRARPGLWEPWEGNDPGPPGPTARRGPNAETAKGPFRSLDIFRCRRRSNPAWRVGATSARKRKDG